MGIRTHTVGLGVLCCAACLGALAATADTYQYDAHGRLIRLTYSSSVRIEYTYDANGNMTSRKAGPVQNHTADQNVDSTINLTELLRVIQFFNSGGFHCADNPGDTEDGFVPGPGANHACSPHASDYVDGPSWTITLTELLRIIQFFNIGGYHSCTGEGTEDGFCPGLK